MQKHAVDSSVLQSVSYDAGSKILELEFREGGTWNYFDFSPSVFKKFIHSESLGSFFVRKIKGKYPELRVR
jgi:hypothetical protein